MPIPIEAYLQAQGFWAHPFATTSAEVEGEVLSSFFVRSTYFDWLLGNPERPESLILFAPVGFGKTSQRLELARELRQRRRPALVITLDDFGGLLSPAATSVDLDAYLDLIRRLTLETLDELLDRHALRREQLRHNQFAEQTLEVLLRLYTPWRRADRPSPNGTEPLFARFAQQRLGPKEWLRTLSGLATAAGFASVYCLLDGLDELQETRDNPTQLFSLLRPLLDAPGLLQECGVAFRFFLPQYVERPMHVSAVGRLDRIPSQVLTWSDNELAQMLQERLRSFSRAPASSSFVRVNSFSALCEPTYDVDRFIIACAGRAPRPMLNLARMIVEEHCRIATTEHDLISQAALDAAVRRLTGAPALAVTLAGSSTPVTEGPVQPADGAPPEPSMPVVATPATPAEVTPGPVPLLFLDARGQIWIGDRQLHVTLGGVARRCLEILWERRSTMVRYEELIEQLYGADWDKRADARASLEKLIQRLRSTLEPDAGASNTYIKTLKGTGYILENYRSA